MPTWLYVALAILVQLGLGLSLGLYYTVTYFGRVATPLPGVLALSAPVQYYLLVGEIDDTRVQSVLWMACFPLALGWWWFSIAAAGRAIGLKLPFGRIVRATWWLAAPLLIPIVPLAVALSGGDWQALLEACLRRRFAAEIPWLTPVYLGLSVLVFAAELRALWSIPQAETVARRIAFGLICVLTLTFVVSLTGLTPTALP